MELKSYRGVTFGLAGLTVLATVSPIDVAPGLRTAFAAPFVLFLPGYAILNATFDDRISGARALAFTVGLSLATVVLTGFVLHLVYGLTPLAWALALTGLTVAFVWRAPVARLRILPARAANTKILKQADGAAFFAALVFAGMAIVIARNGALDYKPFDFTELWLVPSADLPGTYTVGIANQEAATTLYELRVTLGGRMVLNLSGVEIAQGQTWIADVPVAVVSGGSTRLEAWLSRSDQPERLYRSAWLDLKSYAPPTQPQNPSAVGDGASVARASDASAGGSNESIDPPSAWP